MVSHYLQNTIFVGISDSLQERSHKVFDSIPGLEGQYLYYIGWLLVCLVVKALYTRGQIFSSSFLTFQDI